MKNKRRQITIYLFLLLVCHRQMSAKAESLPTAPETQENVTTPQKEQPTPFKMGVNVGTPGGLNATLGWWNVGGTPILLQGTLGYSLYFIGAGAQLGYIFDNEGDFKQYTYLGADSAGGIIPWTGYIGDFDAVSLGYGFNYKGFTMNFGLGYGTGQYYFIIPVLDKGDYKGLVPTLNIGYSFDLG